MLDPKKLRKDTDEIASNLSRRGFEFDIKKWNLLESQRKELQSFNENQQSQLNEYSPMQIYICKKAD